MKFDSLIENLKKLDYSNGETYKLSLESIFIEQMSQPLNNQIRDLFFEYEKDNEIIRTSKDTLLLENGVLKRDSLIYFIKNNRKLNNVTYKLNSIAKFNLFIDPEDVIDNCWSNNYLTQERNMSDIHFSDTITIFQDINSLFIFFTYPTNRNRNTKKVYITTMNNRKTRRRR